MATFPSKVNYATGDILTATNMNDVGGAINLLDGSQTAAAKNVIINGGFDIWQRGTSFASTSGYFADRWTNLADLSGVTASQQTSGVPNGSRYYLRLTSTAGSSYWSSYQFIETSNAATLWGKTAVFSAKVRRNATMSAGINIFVQKSATADAGSGATWTTVGTLAVSNALMPTGTTSTDWYTASSSISIPNDGTANSLRLVINYAAAAPSGSVLDISQVQLEAANTASAFSRAGGTIQGELAACQRYYWRNTNTGASAQNYLTGLSISTSVVYFGVQFPVTMRTAPSSLDYSAISVSSASTGYSGGTTAQVANQTSPSVSTLSYTHGSAALTNDRSYLVQIGASTGYIGFSAEL